MEKKRWGEEKGIRKMSSLARNYLFLIPSCGKGSTVINKK